MRTSIAQGSLMMGSHANWAVLWVVEKEGKKPYLIEHPFGHDLQAAMALYMRAKQAGKKYATLLCLNVAFPPADKYLPRTVVKVKKVQRGGKTKKVRVTREVRPMEVLNNKGIWWCPYCREFRRFEVREGFKVDAIYVPTAGYHCPVCGIPHRDFSVRKYNPRAHQFYTTDHVPTIRGKRGRKRTRAAR